MSAQSGPPYVHNREMVPANVGLDGIELLAVDGAGFVDELGSVSARELFFARQDRDDRLGVDDGDRRTHEVSITPHVGAHVTNLHGAHVIDVDEFIGMVVGHDNLLEALERKTVEDFISST